MERPDDASAFSEVRPGELSGAEQRMEGARSKKAVRRKPLARRTRALCKLNGARNSLRTSRIHDEVQNLGGPSHAIRLH
jgi:hypothetical protein